MKFEYFGGEFCEKKKYWKKMFWGVEAKRGVLENDNTWKIKDYATSCNA